MKTLIALVVVVLVIGGIVRHRQDQAAAPAKVSAAAAPEPATTKPQASRAPSAHNFVKSAIDRANDVKRQVAEQRQSNEVP
jgi:hypothetical protein